MRKAPDAPYLPPRTLGRCMHETKGKYFRFFKIYDGRYSSMLKKKCVQRKVRFSSSYSAPGCLFLKERSRGNIFHDLFQIYSGEYIRNRASSHDLVTFFWAIASKVNLTSSGLWQAISLPLL